MVQFMWSEKKNNDAPRQWPEQGTTSEAGEKLPRKLEQIQDSLEEEEGPLQKRCKASPSQNDNQGNINSNVFPIPASQCSPLNQPSPLGLRLRKSPSLLELIQMRLSQGNANEGALPSENLEAGNKKDARARAGAQGSMDKLKASNFPALLLRIGQWEYVSQHEGDLVAKCYFAKHKLVWEFLDGGLKNKIEIQWADIIALKANFPDNGPSSLTIMLGKKPLFFRETNPQPRKHTLWQATSDFTGGQATTDRQHHLQCAQGVLNKHYEKLIQCDQRLNFLSQREETVVNSPYFAAEASAKVPNVLGNNGSNKPQTCEGSSASCIRDMAPACSSPSFSETEGLVSLGSVHEDLYKEVHPTSSEQAYRGPRLQPTMSMSDLVNHIGHCITEQKSSGNVPFFENMSGGDNPKQMLENISQILLSDTHVTTASDEKTLMSRVNSLCSLLQDSSSAQADEWNSHRNDSSDPSCDPTPEIGMKQGDMGHEEESGNISGSTQASGMSRKDSFTDLVQQLPRITSLPSFLFDISENGEILKP